jgi:hypothetical protein
MNYKGTILSKTLLNEKQESPICPVTGCAKSVNAKPKLVTPERVVSRLNGIGCLL